VFAKRVRILAGTALGCAAELVHAGTVEKVPLVDNKLYAYGTAGGNV